MKIAATVVTCNRLTLLPRALKSIAGQSRKPDSVFVISNSTAELFPDELKLCSSFGFTLLQNHRTGNYAGALNTAIEEIIKHHGIIDDLYFASLDDDDEWLPDYLNEIEKQNDKSYELLAANYLRLSDDENLLMALPENLSMNDFLTGNVGIGGSNTFILLKTLLKAGCFDEAMNATVDRDVLIRVFQQNPTYKVIHKHLVTAYTDKNRDRVTTNTKKKKESFQIFYYKYKHLMTEVEKEKFFTRAKNFFSVHEEEIVTLKKPEVIPTKLNIHFSNKGNYQFIIGFIAGDSTIAERIVNQITERYIDVDLVLVIDDVRKGNSLNSCEDLLHTKNIPCIIVKHHEWKENLQNGHYGSYFKQFSEINSIPLGRTILHHHLFMETTNFPKPVYWIIDDDVSFSAITTSEEERVDLFDLINQNIEKADTIIGSISSDPPVPTLCCIRTQLIDILSSTQAYKAEVADFLSVRAKSEYYYDLSDIHTDHLEVPLFYDSPDETKLVHIFSGKSVSRPVLQQRLKSEEKTITKRGANTLVFNREMLQYYPVINLEVNHKFARRGDLLWALFNQVVSGRRILEHTFALDHNRPLNDFNLNKELDKAAYDIIGYSFNKGILKVIEKIKQETEPNRPKDIFEKLIQDDYLSFFLNIFHQFIERRKTRFLMNYYRIIGLTKLLTERYESAGEYHRHLSDENYLIAFNNTLAEAKQVETISSFFKELTTAIWTYSKSITEISENEELYRKRLQDFFGISKKLRKLGSGAEGAVFTDENFVYKCFFHILDKEWKFLLEKSACFHSNPLLHNIEYFENNGFKFIRYPFHLFKPLSTVEPTAIISFLKHCRANEYVYTNIKPTNFIHTNWGIKMIDYGKSFEPFTDDKFLNTIKRAFLLIKFPKMKSEEFQKLTSKINSGELPEEIMGWEKLWRSVEPRKKEEILDEEIVPIIKQFNPRRILDYGSGKCKTSKQMQAETQAEIFVYDINEEVLKNRCGSFKKYHPKDQSFNDQFDVALLNLVLCEVDNATVKEILNNVSRALVPSGKLVVSICNPDFSHIKKTEFQNRVSSPKSSINEEIITKICVYTGNRKTEFHRPTEKYIELFKAMNFKPINVINTNGINIETLDHVSDFKIFVLANEK
jgi:SAM-dependent methyltransferase